MNLVKAGGASNEVAEEIKKLEESRMGLDARAAEIDAQVGHGRRVAYDVDAVQGALQRFAQFIYRVPIECQVRIIKLLVQQVTVWGEGRVRVVLHELAISDFQRALDGNLGPGEQNFKSRRLCERRGQNQTPEMKNARSRASGAGTGVMELGGNWRGQVEPNASPRLLNDGEQIPLEGSRPARIRH
ncbi:MAG TPA: hypothetical protein DD417_02960 [Elusimicrobia bacterium]|nr:hypothetical protein [Elusimicrobiota bacterium]